MFSNYEPGDFVVNPKNISKSIEITAWTEKRKKINNIMGIKHHRYKIEGIQFHPESILSEYGYLIFKNFIKSY